MRAKIHEERLVAVPVEQDAQIVIDAEGPVGLEFALQPFELYVDEATADRLIEKYGLVASSRPNVVLRVVPDEVRAWLGGTLAPRPAIALDLADDLDSRSQDVAHEALSRR